MPVVQPQPTRHSIEYFGNSLRITIPSTKNWLARTWLGFMTLYSLLFVLAGLGLFILFVSWTIADGLGLLEDSSRDYFWELYAVFAAFIFLWTLFATMFWFLVLREFLRQFYGREVLEIDNRKFRIQYQICNWLFPMEFPVEQVENIRLAPKDHTFVLRAMMLWRKLFRPVGFEGAVAFDSGGRTHRLGLDLEQAEAKQIIRAIQDFLAHSP